MGPLVDWMKTPGTRRYLESGTGVGVAIGSSDLRVVVARTRFGRIEILRAHTIENFRERPAAEWGAEYDRLLSSEGVGHLAAVVVLPRRDVIVRRVELPGVKDEDLGAALAFEADSLHPWEEDAAQLGWARIPATSSVAVGLLHHESLERYRALFAEAGIRVASFTATPAVLFSALRFRKEPWPESFLAIGGPEDSAELYGESLHYPLFSASIPADAERSVALARSELRLDAESQVISFGDLTPLPARAPEEFSPAADAISLAAALSAACPWLALDLNLLPQSARVNTSRMRYVPTAVLAAILVGLLVLWGVQERIERRQYLEALNQEIARLEPRLRQTLELESQIEDARRRALLLDNFSQRVSADMTVLSGVSTLLEPPAWLTQIEIDRETVNFFGEARQAAGLLRLLDTSPLFRNSEFALPISRRGNNESFRIRTVREEAAR